MAGFRLGVLGGTFDPPHLGHLLVAQEAVESLGLSRLLFVVASQPPHKEGRKLSPADVRSEMARAAIGDHPRLGVSEVEFHRDGPSYTVDTLRYFRSEHPDAEIFFILGADQLAEFHEWKDPEEILELATLVAVARDGHTPGGVAAPALPSGRPVEFEALEVTRVDISATGIRERVASGRTIRYRVPEAVNDIIERYRLYRGT